MKLKQIPCPFHPKQMVMVVNIGHCSEETGIGMMEMLTPKERISIFRAVEWFRDNQEWDRFTYQESIPGKAPGAA